jgi:cbb3-type cytochrome oxidase subunit 3
MVIRNIKMNKKVFKLLFIVICLGLLFCFSTANAVTLGGLDYTRFGAGYDPIFRTEPIRIVGAIVRLVLSMAGVFFLCLMIYAGYIWMFARGNEQEVERAKKIIRNAIIGIVIMMFSYAITVFVSRIAIKNISE